MREEKAIALALSKVTSVEATQFLRAAYAELMKTLDEWDEQSKKIVVTDASQVSLIEEAALCAKVMTSKINALEKVRTRLKKPMLDESRALDDAFRAISSAMTPIRDYLKEQSLFVERQQQELINGRYRTLTGLGYKPLPSFDKQLLAMMTQEEFDDMTAFIQMDVAVDSSDEAHDGALDPHTLQAIWETVLHIRETTQDDNTKLVLDRAFRRIYLELFNLFELYK